MVKRRCADANRPALLLMTRRGRSVISMSGLFSTPVTCWCWLPLRRTMEEIALFVPISPVLNKLNYYGLCRSKQDDDKPSLIKMMLRPIFVKCNGIYAALLESASSSQHFTPLCTLHKSDPGKCYLCIRRTRSSSSLHIY